MWVAGVEDTLPTLLLSYQGTSNHSFFLGPCMCASVRACVYVTCPGVPALRAVLSLFLQALHSLGLALLAGLYAARPWRYALKQIGGQFGSSVLSYFLFLKTLLAFNALLLLPLLAFLVGVQAAFPPDTPGPVPTFSGLELLTGGVRPSAPALAKNWCRACPSSPGGLLPVPRCLYG